MKDLFKNECFEDLKKDFLKKTKIILQNKLFIFPENKKSESSQFFHINDIKSEILLKQEKKEELEKFLDCFIEGLLYKENLNNIGEIIDLSYKFNVNHKIINKYILKAHEQWPHLNTNKLNQIQDKNFSNNNEFDFSQSIISYKALKSLVYPKGFFSIKTDKTSVSNEKIEEIYIKFEKSNPKFLSKLDFFFSFKNSNIYNFKESKYNITNFNEHLSKDQHCESKRLFLHKINENFNNKNKKAILIQKFIRSYLVSCLFNRHFTALKTRIIKQILILQSNYRRYFSVKKSKTLIIMKKFHQYILNFKHKIYFCIRSFYLKVKLRNMIIERKVIELRQTYVIKIQKSLRNLFKRLNIKRTLLLEKNYFKLCYPFKAKTVKIKIFEGEFKDKLYDFFFCKIRQTFILYLQPTGLLFDKYRVQFYVDDLVTCDGRYPHIEYYDGLYYNIIDFSTLKFKSSVNISAENKEIITKEL